MRRLTIGWQQVKASLEAHVNITGNWKKTRLSIIQRPPVCLYNELILFFFWTIISIKTSWKTFWNCRLISQTTTTCREQRSLWFNCKVPIDWMSANLQSATFECPMASLFAAWEDWTVYLKSFCFVYIFLLSSWQFLIVVDFFNLARDCLFIGKHAFNKGLYNQAVQWISTALRVALTEHNKTASANEIEPFLSTAIRVVRGLSKLMTERPYSTIQVFLLRHSRIIIILSCFFLSPVCLLCPSKHDDVLERKGPFGENWRTNLEPFDRRRVKDLRSRQQAEQRRMTDTLVGTAGLATNKSLKWEELEVFLRLCRGEGVRVWVICSIQQGWSVSCLASLAIV